MAKLTGIVPIGTYYVPWFAYCIASFYFCDEIVVVNGGFDIKNPRKSEYNIPLEQVSKDISRLDVDGKIFEWTGWTLRDLKHLLVFSTEKNHPPTGFWADSRGINLTLALEKAFERGADWVLSFDSDQVAYADCIKFKQKLQSVYFHQIELVGDNYYLPHDPPDNPFDDAVFSFRPAAGDFYGGGGVIALSALLRDRERIGSEDYHAAHLRFANPPHLSRRQKFEHFFGRMWFQKYTNDYGEWNEQLVKEATESAENLLNYEGVEKGFAPEVCLTDPLMYIEEVIKGGKR